MEQNGKLTKGEIILLTSGEYSDYTVHTVCKVLRDCDVNELKAAFIKETSDKHLYSSFDGFISWITAKKFVKEIEYREFYLGSYDLSDIGLR